jgi:nitroimidazol reductase NimA-like FMN-containing flavoprotein (pyridoxamine 5'-phosphate oxidase superfamily)
MGFLGLSMDNMPYVLPITFGYIEGKILFHCALKGKKLDYIRSNPQVCFTIGRQSGKFIRHPQGGQCRVNHDSVICYGTARIIEDHKERLEILNTFNRCLKPDTEEITYDDIQNCNAVEIKINRMTGRKQRKGIEHSFYEYNIYGLTGSVT